MARKNRTIAASAAISGHWALTTLFRLGWQIVPSLSGKGYLMRAMV